MRINETEHYYGIDLLRIFAMLMIVAHHFSLHSGIERSPEQDIVNAVMALHGKTGVNIFILITGFFAGGKVRSEKIIALLGLTVFYSLSLTGIAYLVDTVALSKKMLLKAALPFLLGNNYWFVITYLELYVLSPLMNRVIESIPRKTYQCNCCVSRPY